VVIAVDGLTSGLSTARYMPKTHVMANRGVYTSHMRTVHDIAVDEVAWDSIFYASSTSVRGCDNNGCDSVAQAIDDMPNWVDILEDEFEDEEDDDDSDDFTVFLFSQDKKTLDDVLDRSALPFAPMAQDMEEAILDYNFPDTPKQLVLVHFSGFDRVGIVSGYESWNYKALVGCTDNSIDVIARHLWARCPNATTFLLISNHGGEKYQHTTFSMNDIQVPFMMWGHRVAAHVHVDDQPLQTTQIGPTLLTVLGMEDSIPDFWIEKPIIGIPLEDEDDADSVIFSQLPAAIDEETPSCEVLPISVDHRTISIMTSVTRAFFFGGMLIFAAFFFVF
jgi:hypothetical protein